MGLMGSVLWRLYERVECRRERAGLVRKRPASSSRAITNW
jgi:hypothetical protein